MIGQIRRQARYRGSSYWHWHRRNRRQFGRCRSQLLYGYQRLSSTLLVPCWNHGDPDLQAPPGTGIHHNICLSGRRLHHLPDAIQCRVG